jgi:hypothetical protein
MVPIPKTFPPKSTCFLRRKEVFCSGWNADNAVIYGEADKACIQQTVERLLSVETSSARPGMLLGKIQSGKTKTFLGAIALAFDNGFDIAVILTKGTKALARQTLERVRRDFARFTAQDQLQIFDIMTVPTALAGYELNQRLVFVAKKQVDNMERLTKLFRETYPQIATRRILIRTDSFFIGPHHLTLCDELVWGQVPE